MAIFSYWDMTFLGIDGLIVYGFYKAYKHFSKEADIIEGLSLYTVGPELFSYVDKLPNKCLAYVGIRGLSKMSEDAYLQTSNYPSVGLINKASKIMHKSIPIFGFWKNVTDKISSMVRSWKFGICAPDSFTSRNDPSLFVEVIDPLHAEYLLDNLPIIKDDFKPDPNFSKNIFSGISGEHIIGHQYKEIALSEGVELFGVGKIFMTSNKPQLCFGPPDLVDDKYILTTLTKPQVVDSLRKEARVFKFLYYTCLICGIALTALLVYDYFRYLRLKRRMFDRMRKKPVTQENVDIGVIPNQSISAPNNQIN